MYKYKWTWHIVALAGCAHRVLVIQPDTCGRWNEFETEEEGKEWLHTVLASALLGVHLVPQYSHEVPLEALQHQAREYFYNDKD